jgi:signal transduction histidine kinase
MTIQDNGIGLPGGGRNRPGSLGLVGIEERINMLGGTFGISSNAGLGTTVRVSVAAAGESGQATDASTAPVQAPGVAMV